VLTKDLHFHEVQGDLSTINGAHVDAVAKLVSAALRQSKGKQGDTSANTTYSPIVKVRFGGSAKIAAFCVPGAGATATCFLSFAEAFTSTIDIVGLQPRGLDGSSVPHCTVEAAAECYVQAILKISPNGPYRLLGHSFGGWIVFEIARQLRVIGGELLPILLLDTDPPSLEGDVAGEYDRCAALTKFKRVVEKIAGQRLAIDTAYFDGLDANQQIAGLMRAMQAVRLLPKTVPPSVLRHTVRVFAKNLNTVYRPKTPLDSAVYLFQVHDPDFDDADYISPEDAARRWRLFARDLRVIPSKGNHVTMLDRPYVDSIANLAERLWCHRRVGGSP
jgi:thioesterase domain-containing protein